MALVTVNGNYLSQTADSLRKKLNTNQTYTADQMPAAIAAIPDAWDWVKDDGLTYLHLDITSKYQLNMSLRLKLMGTIDWGDNTTTTCAHSEVTVEPHTYSALGKYIITITHDEGTTVTLGGGGGETGVLGNGTTTRYKAGALTYLEIGRDITLAGWCFQYSDGLRMVFIRAFDPDPGSSGSNTIYYMNTGPFHTCGFLERVRINHPIYINSDTFMKNYALKEVEGEYPVHITGGLGQSLRNLTKIGSKVVIRGNTCSSWFDGSSLITIKIDVQGTNVNTIYNNFFNSGPRCDKIYIKSGVTKIASNAFSNNYFRELHLEHTEPPSLGASTAIIPTAGYSTIYVPASAVEDYKAATNWSEHADFIKAEVEEWT